MGITLDAGALIALERDDRIVVFSVKNALKTKVPITIPAGVLAQVWRDGRTQANLAKLLGTYGVNVEPLDDRLARAAGQLCGITKTSDVIDASVVIGARLRGDRVMTSDADDLRRLDPSVELDVV